MALVKKIFEKSIFSGIMQYNTILVQISKMLPYSTRAEPEPAFLSDVYFRACIIKRTEEAEDNHRRE